MVFVKVRNYKRYDMSSDEILIAKGLGTVNILPGGFDKRFIKQLYAHSEYSPDKDLSEKQKEWMFRLLYKYRRQIPNMYERFKNVPECSKIAK